MDEQPSTICIDFSVFTTTHCASIDHRQRIRMPRRTNLSRRDSRSRWAWIPFEATGADSVGAQRRLEAGKNGSHPSCLLAGMAKTDFGTALLDVTVLATGAASAVAEEYFKARVAIVTQVKKEVFMGC